MYKQFFPSAVYSNVPLLYVSLYDDTARVEMLPLEYADNSLTEYYLGQ